ncbi:MAG: hypothetical protein OEZ36_14050, partial [Spirochaetota bacterium]|nr:hypothetical protein [Spirochaetota bacterium]
MNSTYLTKQYGDVEYRNSSRNYHIYQNTNEVAMKDIIEKNRWIVVIGAISIQLALGAIYSWSVFTKMLTDSSGIYRFSAKETAWVFSAGLMTFAILMVFAGRLQHRLSPRTLAILGGSLLGLGYILGGIFGHSFLT